jgi:hypothetical protein
MSHSAAQRQVKPFPSHELTFYGRNIEQFENLGQRFDID